MEPSRTVNDRPYLAPSRPTERTVTAELYHLARSAGMEVSLELGFRLPPEFRWYADTHRVFRADLGLIQEGEVVALVEVKRLQGKHPTRPPSPWVVKTSQTAYYNAIGLPWRYCFGFEEIDETFAWLQSFG